MGPPTPPHRSYSEKENSHWEHVKHSLLLRGSWRPTGHQPPLSRRSRCHVSKTPSETLVLPPEVPPFLLLPLGLGEAAQIAAASEPLCPPCSPGGLPAPCPAPPAPASPPAPLPAAGFRGCALLGEPWALWTVPAIGGWGGGVGGMGQRQEKSWGQGPRQNHPNSQTTGRL